MPGQVPTAPPWGTKNTKYNSWGTSYDEYSVIEMGLDMTAIGLDHNSLSGADTCYFPIRTFMVKTRTSASFTSQLKDFAGPYSWGQVVTNANIVGDTVLTCLNPVLTLVANPSRDDITYLWTTDDGNILTSVTNDTINVNAPGTYTLHETLFNGCAAPDYSVLTYWDPAKPIFGTQIVNTTVSCSGSNGTASVTAVGGTAPYTYLWSNSGTTQTITGLSAGTYYVTVTDSWGCTIVSPAAVVGSPTSIIITPTPTSTSCNGGNDGSISLSVSGNGPFTYIWSNSETNQNISNLTAGTYYVTVTDADGCTQTGSSAVTQPNVLSLSITPANETDPTLNNGTAVLLVSGGTGTYTYSGAATTGLSRGTYYYTVTDANGCTVTAYTVIWEPEVCDDGIDNDGNGLTDCYDAVCAPTAPGTITPSNSSPCVGNTGITYTVPNTSGYTYNWTVPSGATITAGTGTNQITVTWNTNLGGQVCVRTVNASGCISSTQSCLTVTVATVPPQPGSIIKTP